MGNLGPVETRKRMLFGAAMLALGVALTIAFFYMRIRGSWLLLLFVPFWLGAIGLLQGCAST